MLVIDNTENVYISQEKKNCHETIVSYIYDSSMDIKETLRGSSIDIKSWLVLEGFLKQVKNRVSD